MLLIFASDSSFNRMAALTRLINEATEGPLVAQLTLGIVSNDSSIVYYRITPGLAASVLT